MFAGWADERETLARVTFREVGRRPNSGSGTGTEELVVSTHRKSMFVLSLIILSGRRVG